jgi:hypothetical protein
MNLFVILETARFGNAGAQRNHKYKKRLVNNKTGIPVQPKSRRK